jgi:hypothetical protein
MDGFIERERAQEAKFQHDQLLEYKILARRNRLFGLWAASLLDLSQEHAEIYARQLASGIMCTADGDEVLEKTLADFNENSVEMSENRARKQLDYFCQDAMVQILDE